MRKYLILGISIFYIFSSCDSNKKRAKKHFDKANLFFSIHDYGKASLEVNLALNLDTTNYDIQILKALIKNETKNYDEAILIFKYILDKKYKSDSVNYYIGKTYFNQSCYYLSQKYDENKSITCLETSITYFDNAISKNTQFFDAYVTKGKALHNLERYDEALITISNAIILFPDSLNLIFRRGVEKNFLGDKKGALIDLNRTIKSIILDSNSMASAYRFRGLIFFDIDSLDYAISDLTMAINFDNKNHHLFINRAEFYIKKGLNEKACEDYRKAADLGYFAIYETIKKDCK